MSKLWAVPGLLVVVLLTTSCCCEKKEVRIERHVRSTLTPMADTSDLAGLPADLRYPGALPLSTSRNETNRQESGRYLLSIPDTLGAVAAFYERVLTDQWQEVAASRCDELVSFDAATEDGDTGVICTLVRQDSSTLAIIVNWRHR